MPQLLEEHDKLIALISGGEVEEACELMGCHIDNQASTVSDVIRRDQVEYHR
jgi:DNA-binding GntR family transcriptional regulator